VFCCLISSNLANINLCFVGCTSCYSNLVHTIGEVTSLFPLLFVTTSSQPSSPPANPPPHSRPQLHSQIKLLGFQTRFTTIHFELIRGGSNVRAGERCRCGLHGPARERAAAQGPASPARERRRLGRHQPCGRAPLLGYVPAPRACTTAAVSAGPARECHRRLGQLRFRPRGQTSSCGGGDAGRHDMGGVHRFELEEAWLHGSNFLPRFQLATS
jgi:hypothetical protein